MERLIEECEQQFHEHFDKRNPNSIKIENYVDGHESFAFKFNALIEKDVHLVRDTHFQEMVLDIERFCSEKYAKSAKGGDKFNVLIAALLRILMRECVSHYDPYKRKLMIESVYQWYREKRKLLLGIKMQSDSSLSHFEDDNISSHPSTPHSPARGDSHDIPEAAFEAPVPTPVKNSVQIATSTPAPQFSKVSILSTVKTEARSITPSDNSAPPPIPDSVPFYANPDKKRQVFINNKLKQFSRRNLAKSRNAMLPEESTGAESQRRMSNSKRASIADADDDDFSKQKNVITNIFRQPTMDPKELNMQKQWLKHRAKQAQEELENIEFRDAVSVWSVNRARIEEEIQRRQESFRFGSQTGVRVHKIIRHDDLSKERQTRLKKQKLIDLKQKNIDQFLDTSSESDSEMDNGVQNNADTGNDENVDGAKTPDVTTARHVLLSPYNNMHEIKDVFMPASRASMRSAIGNNPPNMAQPTTPLTPSSFKASFPLRSDDVIADGPQTSASKGFLRPKYNIFEMTEVQSDVANALQAAYTHRSLPATPKRPNTASMQSRPSTSASAAPAVPNADKIVVHSVFDELERIESKARAEQEKKLQEEAKLRKKMLEQDPKKKKTAGKLPARPSTSPAPTKPGKGGKPDPKLQIREAESVPSSSAPISAPSIYRSMQLDQVEQIKMSLARKGVNVPVSIIQRSILVPEDVPFKDCLTSLPKPGTDFIDDIIPERKRSSTPKKKQRKAVKRKEKKK